MDIDFGRRARDYGVHRAAFPAELWTRLERFGLGGAGQRVLDLGTGTGFVARALAKRGAQVVAVDRSEAMLAEAARLDTEAGVTVRYLASRAEETGLEGASFDAIVCGQAWHWFDRARAAAEARRLLAPRGLLAICHLDWIALDQNLPAATEALIARDNPAWAQLGLAAGDGLYGGWLADLSRAGFAALETLSFDVALRYTHEGWRGRVRASAGVGASLSPEAVDRFDAALAALLARDFPADPLLVPHRVFAAIARRPD